MRTWKVVRDVPAREAEACVNGLEAAGYGIGDGDGDDPLHQGEDLSSSGDPYAGDLGEASCGASTGVEQAAVA